MNSVGFDSAYQGTPLWEIGRPQPAVMALAEGGKLAGRVLDVGCGTGENSLYLAAQGHTVLGIDGAAAAVEQARAKAKQRDVPAEFAVADALALGVLGRRFDVVLDSAFLHIPWGAGTRRAYARQLAAVLPAGGRVYLLEISELVTGPFPSITRAEIVDAFADGWSIEQVSAAVYAVTTGQVPAWLVTVRRNETRGS